MNQFDCEALWWATFVFELYIYCHILIFLFFFDIYFFFSFLIATYFLLYELSVKFERYGGGQHVQTMPLYLYCICICIYI